MCNSGPGERTGIVVSRLTLPSALVLPGPGFLLHLKGYVSHIVVSTFRFHAMTESACEHQKRSPPSLKDIKSVWLNGGKNCVVDLYTDGETESSPPRNEKLKRGHGRAVHYETVITINSPRYFHCKYDRKTTNSRYFSRDSWLFV